MTTDGHITITVDSSSNEFMQWLQQEGLVDGNRISLLGLKVSSTIQSALRENPLAFSPPEVMSRALDMFSDILDEVTKGRPNDQSDTDV